LQSFTDEPKLDADPRVVMDAVTRRQLAEIKSDPAFIVID
jgi:hypothetical protein